MHGNTQDNNYYHVILGYCLMTDQCRTLQSTNNDATSIFVEHDGEIKEVSQALVMHNGKFLREVKAT